MELLRGFILQKGGISAKMLCYQWYLVYYILQELDGWISQYNFRLLGVAAVVRYHQTGSNQYSQMYALWCFWTLGHPNFIMTIEIPKGKACWSLWPLEYNFTGFCHYWYSTVTRTKITKNKLGITKIKLGPKTIKKSLEKTLKINNMTN